MRISPYKSSERQPVLWDEPLGNHGHVRTLIGDLCEGLTADFVGGRRHRTRSDCDYCPDVSRTDPDGVVYFESKAAGLNGQTFVYQGRLEKDRAFVQSGRRLYYVIWGHKARTKDASTVSELERLLLSSVRRVFLVPFADLDAIAKGLKITKLNSGYGSKTDAKTYGSGIRIQLSLLTPFLMRSFADGIVRPLERGF